MAPGTSGPDELELMLDINTTPLIDVLLVLLVMLIITIPVQLHAVNMALPAASAVVLAVTPDKEAIDVNIDAANRIMWQGVVVNPVELEQHMARAAQMVDQPEIRVRPDRACSYAVFAHVLAASKRQGLNKVAVLGSEQFR